MSTSYAERIETVPKVRGSGGRMGEGLGEQPVKKKSGWSKFKNLFKKKKDPEADRVLAQEKHHRLRKSGSGRSSQYPLQPGGAGVQGEGNVLVSPDAEGVRPSESRSVSSSPHSSVSSSSSTSSGKSKSSTSSSPSSESSGSSSSSSRSSSSKSRSSSSRAAGEVLPSIPAEPHGNIDDERERIIPIARRDSVPPPPPPPPPVAMIAEHPSPQRGAAAPMSTYERDRERFGEREHREYGEEKEEEIPEQREFMRDIQRDVSPRGHREETQRETEGRRYSPRHEESYSRERDVEERRYSPQYERPREERYERGWRGSDVESRERDEDVERIPEQRQFMRDIQRDVSPRERRSRSPEQRSRTAELRSHSPERYRERELEGPRFGEYDRGHEERYGRRSGSPPRYERNPPPPPPPPPSSASARKIQMGRHQLEEVESQP